MLVSKRVIKIYNGTFRRDIYRGSIQKISKNPVFYDIYRLGTLTILGGSAAKQHE